MRQLSAAAASPTLFEFAVLFISFCLRPLLPTRKLQNRHEFPPGKPNKRNRLFPLGSFESNILWNTTYFGNLYSRFLADSSENNVDTVLSFRRFILTRKKIPFLTALFGSSIKIIRDLRKPHAAVVCLHAFVIAAFQLFNMSSSEIIHEFRSGRFSKSRGLSASVSSLSPPLPPTSLFRARPISRWKRLLRGLKIAHFSTRHEKLVRNFSGLDRHNDGVNDLSLILKLINTHL